MREWEIGAVENIHGALPYIRFAPNYFTVHESLSVNNGIGRQDEIVQKNPFTFKYP